MSKLIDMTGWIMKEHGVPDSRLTVVERGGRAKSKEVKWICQCECGNTIEVTSSHLRSGHTLSCGCLMKERNSTDISIGDRYGKLTVIEKTDKRYFKSIIYKCKCDCGSIIYVPSNNLTSGHTQSCGCLKSKGELKISQILTNNNIPFEKEKIFEDCKNIETNKPFRFDFWVNNQYLIEFDGSQHFTAGHGWNNKEHLEATQKKDNYKNQYCKNNNIPLIRIPYTQLEGLSLEDLLLETSKFLLKEV